MRWPPHWYYFRNGGEPEVGEKWVNEEDDTVFHIERKGGIYDSHAHTGHGYEGTLFKTFADGHMGVRGPWTIPFHYVIARWLFLDEIREGKWVKRG